MVKAILEFNMPEDFHEHSMAVHGVDWALVVWDMDQWLRNKLKYGHSFDTIDGCVENIREHLHEFMETHGVSLENVP